MTQDMLGAIAREHVVQAIYAAAQTRSGDCFRVSTHVSARLGDEHFGGATLNTGDRA